MNKYFRRVSKAKAKATPRCLSRREGDELVCPTCQLRWDVEEERPACPK